MEIAKTKQQQQTVIDVDEFLYDFKIHEDQFSLFGKYLQEVFFKLIRDESELKTKEIKTISFNSFQRYYELPIVLSKRLFSVFDINNNERLNKQDFISGMLNLFCSDFSTLSRIVFDIYDMDRDGYINKDDIKYIFSYIPINFHYFQLKKSKISNNSESNCKKPFRLSVNKKSKDSKDSKDNDYSSLLYNNDPNNKYSIHLQSKEELNSWLEIIFQEDTSINYEVFLNKIETLCSEVILYLLIFLMENRPFSKSTLLEYQLVSGYNNVLFMTPQITQKFMISSPSLVSNYAVSKIISKSHLIINRGLNALSLKNPITILNKYLSSSHSQSNTNSNNTNKESSGSNANSQIKGVKKDSSYQNSSSSAKKTQVVMNTIKETESYLKKSKTDNLELNNSDEKNEDYENDKENHENEIKNNMTNKYNDREIENNIKNIKENNNNLYKNSILNSHNKSFSSSISYINTYDAKSVKEINIENTHDQIIKMKGNMMKITKNKELKTYYYKLIYKDLFVYKSVSVNTHFEMYNLSGVLYKELPIIYIKEKPFFCFSLHFSSKKRVFLLENEEEFFKWAEEIKKITNYKCFDKEYIICDEKDHDLFKVIERINNRYKLNNPYLNDNDFNNKKTFPKLNIKTNLNTNHSPIKLKPDNINNTKAYNHYNSSLFSMRIGKSIKTNENFIIKTINKRILYKNSKNLEYIMREIEVLKASFHPNIIKVIEIIESEEYIYVVMENLKGGDLKNYIQKYRNVIDEDVIKRIIFKILSVVCYLYSFGRIHFELSINNIYMIDDTKDSDLKVFVYGVMDNTEFDSNFECDRDKGKDPISELKSKDIWDIGLILYYLCLNKDYSILDENFDFNEVEWEGCSIGMRNMIRSKKLYINIYKYIYRNV